MALPTNPPLGGMTHGKQDDVVIAVMGSTGTGKSSFIKLLTGNMNIKVGNSLESETSDVQIIRFHDPTSGRNVTIVDTPGFDDSRVGVTDTDILKTITNFLLKEYDNNRKLTGLLYLTRISDPRFTGQSTRNLRMFRNLCGTETYKNVVVLTTFWDHIFTAEEGEEREEQLKSRFFKELAEGSARFMRHDRTIESARRVLGHIFTLAPANVQIQEEIRVQGKTLENTAAGSMHREEMESIIARHRAEVADLRSEMDALKQSNETAKRELEEERAKLLQELARWEKEKLELKEGLDGERKAREQLEEKAVEERKNQDQWRVKQERKWSSQLDAQAKAHASSLQEMKQQHVEKRQAPEELHATRPPEKGEERKRSPQLQNTQAKAKATSLRNDEARQGAPRTEDARRKEEPQTTDDSGSWCVVM